jgi:integrase
MHIPKLCLRKQTQSYYVTPKGEKPICLGQDYKSALKQYTKIIEGGQTDNLGVQEVIRRYYKWLKKNRRPTTYEPRHPLLKSFGEHVGKLKVSKLKPHHVQDWLDTRDLNPTTENSRIGMIIGMFNWAVKMGHIDKNPIDGMPKPERLVRQVFLPSSVWSNLLDAATDQCFLDWLTIMLYTGCRAEEMFKLRSEHFDKSRVVLPMADSKGRKKNRVIYVPKEVIPIVERLVSDTPKGVFLLNSKGRPWNKDSINCRFKRLKKVMNEPKLCATVLRHSFAHHRLTGGQDALNVSTLLGQKDTTMLALRYGHLMENRGFMESQMNLQIDSCPSVVV